MRFPIPTQRWGFNQLLQACLGLCLYLGAADLAMASIDVREFKNDVERQRYESFIEDMRCPKCQNQNLAGSDSPIALDLRNELYLQIQEGRSDKEIVDFMVERYGDFILYKPRLTSSTLLLWGLPLVLLVLGGWALALIVRRRREPGAQEQPLSVAEQARLRALLEQLDTSTQNTDKPTSGETR